MDEIKVGGRAYNNGVEFSSYNYAVRCIVDNQGEYKIKHKRVVQIKGMRKRLRRIPVLKGLCALLEGKLLIILPVAGMVIADLDLFGSVLAGKSYFFMTLLMGLIAIGCLAYAIKTVIYKANATWTYHGAEHKTIYAYYHNASLTLENVREAPRIAGRCGTNLMVFGVFFYIIIGFFIDYQSVKFIAAFVLGYELFDLENGDKIPIIKLFFVIGHWCQQKLTTREPSDIQIIASIDALNKLISLEKDILLNV